jgi:hypothetical protein
MSFDAQVTPSDALRAREVLGRAPGHPGAWFSRTVVFGETLGNIRRRTSACIHIDGSVYAGRPCATPRRDRALLERVLQIKPDGSVPDAFLETGRRRYHEGAPAGVAVLVP